MTVAGAKETTPPSPMKESIAALKPTSASETTSEADEVCVFMRNVNLSQYSARLLEEGFDSLFALFSVEEQDLDVLGFKLGHKRLLLRAIAETQKMAQQPSSSVTTTASSTTTSSSVSSLVPLSSTRPPSQSVSPSTSHRRQSCMSETHDDDPRKSIVEVLKSRRVVRKYPRKDENAPPPSQTAYNVYCQQHRDAVVQEFPGLDHTGVTKLLSQMWHALSEDARKPFIDSAEASKKAREVAVESYKKTNEYQAYVSYLNEWCAQQIADGGEISRHGSCISAKFFVDDDVHVGKRSKIVVDQPEC